MELLFFAWRELRASLRAHDSFGRYIAVDTRCAVAHVGVISDGEHSLGALADMFNG